MVFISFLKSRKEKTQKRALEPSFARRQEQSWSKSPKFAQRQAKFARNFKKYCLELAFNIAWTKALIISPRVTLFRPKLAIDSPEIGHRPLSVTLSFISSSEAKLVWLRSCTMTSSRLETQSNDSRIFLIFNGLETFLSRDMVSKHVTLYQKSLVDMVED